MNASMQSTSSACRHILVIDDNRSIHEDFRKILLSTRSGTSNLDEIEGALFGETAPAPQQPAFEVDSAFQGREGLDLVRRAVQENHPYPMAFVDMRMPPGWDGIETISKIWDEYPDLQVVICTAYADYSWEQMLGKLGNSDRLVILKKPFDNIEVRQLAQALTEKWEQARECRLKVEHLEKSLDERAAELAATKAALESETAERKRIESELRRTAAGGIPNAESRKPR